MKTNCCGYASTYASNRGRLLITSNVGKQSKNILLPVWVWARVAPARWAEARVEQDWSLSPILSRLKENVIDPKGPLV